MCKWPTYAPTQLSAAVSGVRILTLAPWTASNTMTIARVSWSLLDLGGLPGTDHGSLAHPSYQWVTLDFPSSFSPLRNTFPLWDLMYHKLITATKNVQNPCIHRLHQFLLLTPEKLCWVREYLNQWLDLDTQKAQKDMLFLPLVAESSVGWGGVEVGLRRTNENKNLKSSYILVSAWTVSQTKLL